MDIDCTPNLSFIYYKSFWFLLIPQTIFFWVNGDGTPSNIYIKESTRVSREKSSKQKHSLGTPSKEKNKTKTSKKNNKD